jgi:hypothetical protein
VLSLSANLLFFAQLTKKGKIVEIWSDQFFFLDLKKGQLIIVEGFLNLKENLYKFYDTTQPNIKPDAFFAHID